jgi:hypothetical protein
MLLADFGDAANGAAPLPAGALEIAIKDPGPSVDRVALRQDGHLLAQAFPTSRDLAL